MKVLTVKEAVAWVNSGGNLKGIVLEEQSMQQVNVRDAMVLSRGGIVIPEERIYYDDADIEYDKDIDELNITSGPVQLSWEEKARRAAAQQDSFDQVEDEGIAYDEAFEGNWKVVATDGLAEAESKIPLQLQLIPEVKAWLEQQEDPAQLLERLLENFYQVQQMIKKK